MSCFMVGNLTMSRVLIAARMKGMLAVSDIDAARYLWTFNAWAHEERYPGRYEDEREVPRFEGHRVREHDVDRAEAFAIYKALCCLSYQCSEGDAFESEPWLWLTRLIDKWAVFLAAEGFVKNEPLGDMPALHHRLQHTAEWQRSDAWGD